MRKKIICHLCDDVSAARRIMTSLRHLYDARSLLRFFELFYWWTRIVSYISFYNSDSSWLVWNKTASFSLYIVLRILFMLLTLSTLLTWCMYYVLAHTWEQVELYDVSKRAVLLVVLHNRCWISAICTHKFCKCMHWIITITRVKFELHTAVKHLDRSQHNLYIK